MDNILCKCGCGNYRPKHDKKGRNRYYINRHQRLGKYKDKERRIECMCGCGTIIPKYGKDYSRKYYVKYHQNVGRKASKEFCIQQSVRNKKLGIKPPIQTKCGEDHWNWQGGISTVNNTERRNSNHKLFSRMILKKDNYTCFLCGQYGPKSDNKLIAHHLLLWAEYPEYRFNINNGICLCEKCHKNTHKRLRR